MGPFFLTKKYSDSELADYESKINIKLPGEYKYFLSNVGASKIYIDEYGLGIEFYPIEYLNDFSNKVFTGMKNPFPKLLLVAGITGRGNMIGFDLRTDLQNERLATFSSEEDPEKWLYENESWTTFNEWLIKLVESQGEDELV